LAHLVREVCEVDFSEVILVSGHERAAIEGQMAPLVPRVRCVWNERYTTGMQSSIHKGLKALSEPYDAFMVCLADQPLLRARDLRVLVAAFREHSQAKLVSPTYAGQRGNPVIISASLRDDILASAESDRGCAYLFHQYPALYVPVTTSAFVHDVDTLEQYRELTARQI
jgi:CTP:molybdopterin cytidylyltransferase MocA